MNSQNRMNAGAEYVLYRIWATLQSHEGIHAESLLACVGALAGYACQAYARRTGARAELPLIASPLSVWALVRRSLQKQQKPFPDIDEISAHVTRTLGTSGFGVPRVADDGHRPHKLPVVYLTQLWPQILPIAQRFCRRPAQLPVLFGIALQRALEHTTDRLNPTVGASIAMECAVAMSKATLPSTLSDLFQAPPAAPDITVTSKPATAPLPEIRATRKKRTPSIDPSTLEAGFFSTRTRSTKVVATILSVAIVAITTAALRNEKRDDAPLTARVETKLRAPAFRAAPLTANPLAPASTSEEPPPFDPPIQQAQVDNEAAPGTDVPPEQQATLQPTPTDEELPAAVPDQGEGIIAEDWQQSA